MPVLEPGALIEDRVRAINDYHATTGIERAELDVSGGIDSATMLLLLERALGAEQVTAVFSGFHSSTDSLERARAAAQAGNVALIEVELSDVFDDLYRHAMTGLSDAGYDMAAVERRIAEDPTILGSIRSCLRAPVGRAFNRLTGGGVRHGTGNECEDRFLRFFQKGGDGEVDTNPIAMLSKGEVFQLAHALGVPRSVLEAVPSPDLHGIGAEHNDEDELLALHGVEWTYSKVDAVTGRYTYVGTIERMARLDDEPDVAVFGDAAIPADELERILDVALARAFAGFDRHVVHELVESARRAERTTRHKWNPNCPTLGDRATLLAAGVLTNDIPEV